MSKTLEAVARDLAQREAAGFIKYGTTVDRTDLSSADCTHHLYGEL